MNGTPMAAGRRADSARRRQRVIKALSATARTGEEISVSGIARQAGVDRAFLYRHRDLLEQVHAAEAKPPADGASSSLVSRASLQADLAGAQARTGRLGARVRQLEKKLSELLGERAWQESGLGAPQDTGTLKRRITDLEQKTADLSGQLAERTGELAAARAANREMMAHLNGTSR